MQGTTVVTALVTAVVFGVAGWFLAPNSGKVTILTHPHPLPRECRGNDCDVTIKLDCAGSACEPYAEYDVILVNTGHKIKFTIDNPPHSNYAFDQTDGIKFISPNSGTYLPCAPQGQTQDKYTCDNNIPPGTPTDIYKYQIHITGLPIVDPWMVNY